MLPIHPIIASSNEEEGTHYFMRCIALATLANDALKPVAEPPAEQPCLHVLADQIR